jgi:hypothetical protein
MKKDRQALIAYAAGIIDGEGHVGITKRSPGKTNGCINPSYSIRITVKMNNAKAIDLLHGLFGGRISLASPRNSNIIGNYSVYFPGFSWEVTGERAKRSLKLMLGFLRVKKRQAELAIMLQTRLEVGFRNKGQQTGCKKGNPLSDHELQTREDLYKTVSSLNKQSIELPHAGLTTEQAQRAESLKQDYLKRQSELTGIETVSASSLAGDDGHEEIHGTN